MVVVVGRRDDVRIPAGVEGKWFCGPAKKDRNDGPVFLK
jgi:hypothetical protein